MHAQAITDEARGAAPPLTLTPARSMNGERRAGERATDGKGLPALVGDSELLGGLRATA